MVREDALLVYANICLAMLHFSNRGLIAPIHTRIRLIDKIKPYFHLLSMTERAAVTLLLTDRLN
jgi:hypothetical protein